MDPMGLHDYVTLFLMVIQSSWECKGSIGEVFATGCGPYVTGFGVFRVSKVTPHKSWQEFC